MVHNMMTMMMTQTFVATIAFSIGLLAFCAGAWLTIWSTSGNQCSEVSAAKLTGYFVTVLALISLVFTSYFIAKGVFASSFHSYGMNKHFTPMTGKHNMMKKNNMMKHTNPNVKQ